jgi:putative FmdB family regulatory protein
MPLFEFRCEACGGSFEKRLDSANDVDKVVCSRCGAARVRRKMSSFAAVGGRTGNGYGAASAPACAPGGG